MGSPPSRVEPSAKTEAGGENGEPGYLGTGDGSAHVDGANLVTGKSLEGRGGNENYVLKTSTMAICSN